MGNQKLPNIFEYVSFRKYLEDYRLKRKEWDPGFTHSYICYFLGQKNSRTLFSNIVSGRRNMSSLYVNRFVELLELSSLEEKYFRILVPYDQTQNPADKELYFEQLIQQNQIPKRILGENYTLYYSAWYHSTIRSLLDFFNFNNNYSELASFLTPVISTSQAKKSISLLKEMGLISLDNLGFYRPTDSAVSSGGATPKKNLYTTKYQLECLEQAKLALLNNDPDNYKAATLTMSASKSAMQKIVQRAEQFRKEVFAIVESDEEEMDRVYQLQIQMYGQTKEGGR